MSIPRLILIVILFQFEGVFSRFNNESTTNHRLRRNYDPMYPLCTDLKQKKGMSNGAFITKEPARWKFRSDGSREYTIDTCRLKRFTPSEARQCLRGEHILMTGDSLTRYQYLSLVNFIENERWPPRFQMESECPYVDKLTGVAACSEMGSPSIVAENDWAKIYGHAADKSWKQMHMHIGGAGFNGRVECQCFRGEADTSVESLFYESAIVKPLDGTSEAAEKRVKVTFLNDLVHNPIHWFKRNHCSSTGTCKLTSADWDQFKRIASKKKFDYEAFPHEQKFVDHIVDTIPDVTIAMSNRGIWGNIPMDKNHAATMFQNLYNITKRNNGKCFWKGTTAYSGDYSSEEFAAKEVPIRKLAYKYGCGVYDLSHVTKQFINLVWDGDLGKPGCCGEKEFMEVYFDAAHFRPWVLEEMNQILLNMLC